MIDAKVIADSVSPDGVRLLTFQLRYQRFIHAEFMTHRVFGRNASSSRAIPVAKMIEQVRTSPAMPLHWGANQPGMQANGEVDADVKRRAEQTWRVAADYAARCAEDLAAMGLHKQVANRLLEPFQFMHVVVTATEWDNFFELRDHHMAEPNIQVLAREMKKAMEASTPIKRPRLRDHELGWHLPYVRQDERNAWATEPLLLAKLSTARCARVSYMTHDGKAPDPAEDIKLFERLVGSKPMHASPTEHQAYPAASAENWYGNLRGWHQHRKWLEAA